jgi:hypothetical protein
VYLFILLFSSDLSQEKKSSTLFKFLVLALFVSTAAATPFAINEAGPATTSPADVLARQIACIRCRRSRHWIPARCSAGLFAEPGAVAIAWPGAA